MRRANGDRWPGDAKDSRSNRAEIRTQHVVTCGRRRPREQSVIECSGSGNRLSASATLRSALPSAVAAHGMETGLTSTDTFASAEDMTGSTNPLTASIAVRSTTRSPLITRGVETELAPEAVAASAASAKHVHSAAAVIRIDMRTPRCGARRPEQGVIMARQRSPRRGAARPLSARSPAISQSWCRVARIPLQSAQFRRNLGSSRSESGHCAWRDDWRESSRPGLNVLAWCALRCAGRKRHLRRGLGRLERDRFDRPLTAPHHATPVPCPDARVRA